LIDPHLAHAVAKYWKWIVGVSSTGVLGYALKVALGRLRPDQLTYVEVIEQFGLLADAIVGTVGLEASLTADSERCRKAYAHRRRAGENIVEMYPGEKFKPFIPRLTALDRALRTLEDALHRTPYDGQAIAAARDVTADLIAEARRAYILKSDGRMSVRALGRKRIGKSGD
jgi:hypothetical protein